MDISLKFGSGFGFGSSTNFNSTLGSSKFQSSKGFRSRGRGRGQKPPRDLMTKMEPREVRQNDLYTSSNFRSELPQTGVSYRSGKD